MGHLWICDGGEEDMDMWKDDTHMWEEGVGEGCFVLQTPLKCWPLTNQSKKPHGGGFIDGNTKLWKQQIERCLTEKKQRYSAQCIGRNDWQNLFQPLFQTEQSLRPKFPLCK